MATAITVPRTTRVITHPATASSEPNHGDALTSCEYWEAYYRGHRSGQVEREAIAAAGARYDSCWEAMRSAVRRDVESVCEIGCYPGRYLAYVAAKFDLRAHGIDFNPDRATIESNLAVMGVRDSRITTADFLRHVPEETADLVFSLGFVEHFLDVQQVLDLHLRYLKPGGALFIAIPNMRGLVRPYKLLVDRANLGIHNLASMRLVVLEEFAKRNGMKIHLLGFRSGFPANVHQQLNTMQKLLYYPVKLASRRLDTLIERHPSFLYSGEIVALFTR